jgi:V-type H+-transporting ATPase subunit a
MNFLILYKWCVDWSANPSEAPNLIQTMINMFLKPGVVAAPMFAGQAATQSLLLFIALASVPVMLLARPLAERRRHRAARDGGSGGGGGRGGDGGARVSGSFGEQEMLLSRRLHSQSYGGIGDSAILTDAADSVSASTSTSTSTPACTDDVEHEFVFSDILITQSIHTIEFVLGCVSNTASYLRLWGRYCEKMLL